MDCKEIRTLLSRYLEGDLDLDMKSLVTHHLESCEGCVKELDALKSMVSSLGKLKKVEPPFDFLESVHQRLEKPSWTRVMLRRMFYPPLVKLPIEAVAFAAVILLIIRIVSFISPGEVMVAKRPERIEVAMKKEERLPVIDYEVAREMAALKEPSISGVEIERGAGISRLVVPSEELAKAMFVANPQLPTITKEVAVQLANQFVTEQGYTDVNASLPTSTLYFDEFEQRQQSTGVSTEEILEVRYNSIERVPVITYEDEMSWNVIYRVRNAINLGQVVNVDKNTAKVRMIPKKVSLDYLLKK